jgi:5-phospho-D-xylono-1,4-lactonase
VPWARTVRGDVDVADLGATYGHEHLLTAPRGLAHRDDEDLRLDDEARAVRELASFRAADGGALLEATTPEMGRDPEGLRRVSEASEVHVVAVTGHICEEYWRGALDPDRSSVGRLADRFVHELTVGMDGTDVRAGAVKAGTSADRVTAGERKVLLAAAEAQRSTGAPITTHTTGGTMGLEQVRILEGAGADLEHLCIGHLDRRLRWPDHLALAREGIFLGYDCVGKEQYQPDAERVRFLRRLLEEGYGHRVLLAGDMARRRYLRAWGGGPGYGYILGEFAGRLRRSGVPGRAITDLLVRNPARFLAWRA